MKSRKKWQYIKLMVLGAFLVLVLTKCEKQKNFKYVSNPPDSELGMNAWQFIQKKDSFSLLESAISTAGLEDFYSGNKDDKTFILPTNSAFRAYMTSNDYSGISNIPQPILKYILLYHVVEKKVVTSDTALVKADPMPYTTENGQKMYLSRNTKYQLVINEGTSKSWIVRVSNLIATNGALQIVPAVVYYSADVPKIENPNLQQDTIEAIQDGYVNNGWKKTQNYSDEDLIKVKNVGEDVEGGIYDRRGFLMFDLNDLDKKGKLRTAVVEVGVSFTAAKGIPLYLLSVNDNSWSENSLTWANAPQADPDPVSSLISKKEDVFKWDISDYIADKLDNPGKISFKIDAEEGSDETDEFYSHRSSSGPHPRIIVTFTSGNSNLAMGINKGITVSKRGIGVLSEDVLEMKGAAHGDIIYTIEALPSDGWLINGVTILKQGDSFTQLDVDANNIVYVHNNQSSTEDSFSLSVSDLDGGSIAPFDVDVTIE